ncbi:PDZ domain-containing protein [Natribacillus halophilus]|nr:PDZ domain-containing protein [Natribacillus halophilus]
MDNWFADLWMGIGSFFIHPLTYIGILAMLWVGYRRVNRERTMFHTALGNIRDEIFHRLLPGVLAGLILSVVAVAVGVVLNLAFSLLLTVVYLLLIIIGGARFASPAYALGLALILSHLWPGGGEMAVDPLPVLLLIAAFLMVEGLLVRLQAKRQSFSPLRLLSKRGKWIGGQRLDRMWLVPVCVLVPGDTFATGGWWPFMPISDDVSILLLPFLVGFQQSVVGQRLVRKLQGVGTRVFGLGVLVVAFVVALFFLPEWMWLPAVLMAILGRCLLQIYEYSSDRKKPFYFIPRDEGLVILGILPGSPAEKMNLMPGETIMKVHGEPVNTEWDFYQRLQLNPAYGRVEVMDHNGERRVEKAALYDDQHHELGVLFLHQNETHGRTG